MTAIFGSHGDAPKVVMAPSTIEDCYYSIITARKIAETFNMVVVVLSDAGLATSQNPFPRPVFKESWLAPPIDQSPIPEGGRPYDWDPTTGLARRFIPGQPGGMHTLTGLTHDRDSHVAYDAEINEQTLHSRSLKLAALQKTLKAPPVFGGDEGDLLIIGWGSTKGAIEESVEALRAEGKKVSSMHLRFLNPMPPGIKEVMQRFKKVMTIEGNWSDRPEDTIIDETNRRYSALAMLLRSRYLVDVDCWSEVKGQEIKPGTMRRVIGEKLKQLKH
jgi:2-oxoglutarate ferredoxin oxidoreductase subunit alpha